MLYQFELLLDTKNVILTARDRFNNPIPLNLSNQGTLVRITTDISMPNGITIGITKTDPSGIATLKSAWLGQIKFHNDSLSRLFVYHHEYGMARSCEWEFGGEVEFELFDHDPITYHLNMGTRI